MGRTARQPKDDHKGGEGGGITGEYKRPDAKRALKIFHDEIAPKQAHMSTIKGDLSDPYKRIKDECHFPRKVLDFLVVLADMEEAKRDHFLLALNLGMSEMGLFMPRDLATIADGEDGAPVIPSGARKKPQLVTVPKASDGTETDLVDAAVADEPATGTSAAAIAAMRADHAADKAAEDDAIPAKPDGQGGYAGEELIGDGTGKALPALSDEERSSDFDEASEEELAQQEGRGGSAEAAGQDDSES